MQRGKKVEHILRDLVLRVRTRRPIPIANGRPLADLEEILGGKHRVIYLSSAGGVDLVNSPPIED